MAFGKGKEKEKDEKSGKGNKGLMIVLFILGLIGTWIGSFRWNVFVF